MNAGRSVPGFSLIELLLSLAILGLLSAVALPAYQDYTLKTRATESVTLTQSARSRVAQFYAQHGRFPADNNEAGLPEPGQISSSNIKSVQIQDGAIHVRFSLSQLSGSIVTLRPLVSRDYPSDNLLWVCGDKEIDGFEPVGPDLTNIERKYVPYCRL